MKNIMYKEGSEYTLTGKSKAKESLILGLFMIFCLFIAMSFLLMIASVNAEFVPVPKCVNDSYLGVSMVITENGNVTTLDQGAIFCPYGCKSNIEKYGDDCKDPQEITFCANNETLYQRYFDGKNVREIETYCSYGCINQSLIGLGYPSCGESDLLLYIVMAIVIILILTILYRVKT